MGKKGRNTKGAFWSISVCKRFGELYDISGRNLECFDSVKRTILVHREPHSSQV